ncbi:MAG: hypothetical protein ACI4KD_00015 [Oscillospiraceae bacterium]
MYGGDTVLGGGTIV